MRSKDLCKFARQLLSAFALAGVISLPVAAGEAPLVVGALGDSLTTGFDAKRFGDNREYSWSTGTQIASYAQRLGKALDRPVVSANFAIAGARSYDLNRQAKRLLKHHPDFATITIGANDLCNWPLADQDYLARYEESIHSAIETLVTARPQIKIHLSNIPDMINLWRVGVQQGSCQVRWNTAKICQPLFGAAVTDEERAAFGERWLEANDALDRIASDFPNNVLHNPDARHHQFTWREISKIDCFHPSVEGQELLAQIAWQRIAPEL